jgi:hypothetical protein
VLEEGGGEGLALVDGKTLKRRGEFATDDGGRIT